MSLSRAEKESILRWSEDKDDAPTFYTHNQALAKRLIGKGARLKAEAKLSGKVVAWTLELPGAVWSLIPRRRKQVKAGGNASSLAKAREARKSSATVSVK